MPMLTRFHMLLFVVPALPVVLVMACGENVNNGNQQTTTSSSSSGGSGGSTTTSQGGTTSTGGQGGTTSTGGQGGTTSTGGQGGTTSTGGAGGTTSTGGQGGAGGTSIDGGVGGQGGTCTAVIVNPVMDTVPADAIVVIDSSASMVEELQAVEQNLNANFAQIMANAGVDYRVIVVTPHGSGTLQVCVPPPLSATTNCAGPPVFVSGQFYQYSVGVGSHDSLCKILATMDGATPDTYNLAPNGWETWLRPAAEKFFIEVSDDGVTCTHNSVLYDDADMIQQGQQVAIDFDIQLLAASPAQFGSQSDRRYHFYSIVGIPQNGTLQFYGEFDPVVTGTCPTGIDPGTGYQWLSKGTHAKRFESCAHSSYGAFLQLIAGDIANEITSACEFTLPPPPGTSLYDYPSIEVVYTPGGGSPQTLVQVPNLGVCVPGAFYVEQGNHLVLCPQVCQLVEADSTPLLEVRLPCGYI